MYSAVIKKLLTLLLLLTSSFVFAAVTFVDSYNVSSQETGPREIAFNSDGTKFFVTGYQGSDVGEYSMSTAWDVSTASYTDAFSVGSQTGGGAHGLAFNTNGTKMFVMSYGSDQVHEYALSTGWDVSTASYTDGFDVSSQDTEPRGLAFSTDGTKMFISGNEGNTIEEYTLSTGFDVSTSSHTDTMDVSDYDTNTRGVTFNDDGTTLFFHAQQNNKVHSWKLSTGYDISTNTYNGSISLPSFDTGAEAIVFNNDGTKLFVSGNNDNTIDEYTVSTGFELINTAPTLSSSSPSDGATGVAVDANIVLTFKEVVDVESGNIVIKKSSDDSTVETIDVTGSLVTGTGTTEITINPSTTLDGETGYYITIAATAFDDVDSASYAGITDSTTLNFTTADVGDPTLSSSSPADGATGVAVDANIVLTFSEAVDVESGNITLKKSSDDSTVETIDVTGSLVTGTGTTEITINPSTTLDGETSYYITIADTAFDDDSSNSYAGITDSTTLNFTTVATNLPSPLDKKDVIGSIEAWSNISSEWIKFNIDNAFDRINWLNRQRGSNQTSHQGIKLSFVDTLIDKIMNNSPGTALSDIDVVDTAASMIGSSNATLDEVSDNAESKANDIAINEAAILREALIGSLNPSFGPVIGDWSVWTKGRIVIGKTDASTTASKQEIDVQSIKLGIDRPVGDGDELMGFVLSIGQNNNDIGIASTNVKSDNYSLANYDVIKLNDNTKTQNVFGVSHLEFDTLRSDGSDILTGKRKAKQLFLSTTFKPEDTRYVGNWKVSPYSKVLLANTRLNSFSESGGATALTFNKQYVKDAGLSVGMDINSTVTVNNATINPYAKLEYTRSSSKTSAPMHYNNEDASSYTYTANLNKQIKNWKLKLGADLITESGWNSSVSYTREQPFGSGQASKYSNSFSFNADIQF